jgi:hypothetical protein
MILCLLKEAGWNRVHCKLSGVPGITNFGDFDAAFFKEGHVRSFCISSASKTHLPIFTGNTEWPLGVHLDIRQVTFSWATAINLFYIKTAPPFAAKSVDSSYRSTICTRSLAK